MLARPGPEAGPGQFPHAQLRSARLAVLVYFVIMGLAEGIWIARIPAVKGRLHLADGLLGASLLDRPVLSEPVLSEPVLSEPVLSEPVLSGTDPGRPAGSRSR